MVADLVTASLIATGWLVFAFDFKKEYICSFSFTQHSRKKDAKREIITQLY